jgi:hypothetical protein
MGVPVFVPGAGAVGCRLIAPDVSPISKEVLRNERVARNLKGLTSLARTG